MSFKYAGYFLESFTDQYGHALVAPSTIAVYLTGTVTLATLYTDQTKLTTTANPFTIAANGDVNLYADPGLYDISATYDSQVLPSVTIPIPLNPLEIGSAPDQIATFNFPGALYMKTGAGLFLLPYAGTIVSVTAVTNSAPTGASVNLDVLLNGTTLWPTNPSNRPNIPISGMASGIAIPDTTAFAAGSTLSVNVLQVGSTVPGSDLTVAVRYN